MDGKGEEYSVSFRPWYNLDEFEFTSIVVQENQNSPKYMSNVMQ